MSSLLNTITLLATELPGLLTPVQKGIDKLFYDTIIPIIFWLGGLIFIVFGVLRAIELSQAKQPEERQTAKKNLTWFFIGMAACFIIAYAVPKLVEYFQSTFPNPTNPNA